MGGTGGGRYRRARGHNGNREGHAMRQAIRTPSAILVAAALAACLAGPAAALDQVSLGTDWKAEAEHGGYYQANATRTYAKNRLPVSPRPGGPQGKHSQPLPPPPPHL